MVWKATFSGFASTHSRMRKAKALPGSIFDPTCPSTGAKSIGWTFPSGLCRATPKRLLSRVGRGWKGISRLSAATPVVAPPTWMSVAGIGQVKASDI